MTSKHSYNVRYAERLSSISVDFQNLLRFLLIYQLLNWSIKCSIASPADFASKLSKADVVFLIVLLIRANAHLSVSGLFSTGIGVLRSNLSSLAYKTKNP